MPWPLDGPAHDAIAPRHVLTVMRRWKHRGRRRRGVTWSSPGAQNRLSVKGPITSAQVRGGAPRCNQMDDIELLDQMMSDLRQAPRKYRPTKFWANNESELVTYLNEYGLRDFRRQHSTGARNILMSFGATDLLRDEWAAPELERTRVVSNGVLNVTHSATTCGSIVRLRRFRGMSTYAVFPVCMRVTAQSVWRLLRRRVPNGAQSPSKHLHLSMIGNPEDRFDADTPALVIHHAELLHEVCVGLSVC